MYIASYTSLFFTDPISVDPCSRVKCGQGEKCVIKVNEKKTDKFAQCQCISVTDNCFESFHVCASDNNTYKSVCHMDAAACASKKSLTVLYDEDCKHCKCLWCCVACIHYVELTINKTFNKKLCMYLSHGF